MKKFITQVFFAAFYLWWALWTGAAARSDMDLDPLVAVVIGLLWPLMLPPFFFEIASP